MRVTPSCEFHRCPLLLIQAFRARRPCLYTCTYTVELNKLRVHRQLYKTGPFLLCSICRVNNEKFSFSHFHDNLFWLPRYISVAFCRRLNIGCATPTVLPITPATRVDSSVVLHSAHGEYTRSVLTLARGNNVEMCTGCGLWPLYIQHFGADSEKMDYKSIGIVQVHSSCWSRWLCLCPSARRWSLYKIESGKSPRPFTSSEFGKRSILSQMCVHKGFSRVNLNRGGPVDKTTLWGWYIWYFTYISLRCVSLSIPPCLITEDRLASRCCQNSGPWDFGPTHRK